MSTIWHDFRLSVRLLRRGRAFAAAALATIALSTGANTAIFSLVYSVVLRPLPFPAPHRLVSVTQFYPTFKETVVTAPVYFDWLEGAPKFARFAAYSMGQYTLTGAELSESVPAALVSQQFFDVLGARPETGRTFSAEEDRPGAEGVVMVSRSFWNGRPRRDSLELDGRSYRVIGVMPAEFAFPPNARLWVPLALDPMRERAGGPVEMVRVIGRLRNGATTAGLTAALAAVSARVQGFSAGGRPLVVPLRSWLTGKTQHVWFVLMGVVAIVLLIACANVAGLLIARGAARRGEMAIRMALGAPAGRLVRQLLIESLVLAMAGSAAGFALAVVLIRAMLPLIPDAMLAGRPVKLDAPVFVFTMGTALAITLLFGSAPAREALRITRKRPVDLRGALVAAEVALSLVVLVAATIMVRSFSALTAVDPGFRPDHALTLTVTLPAATYREPARQYQFYALALDALAALPGVRGAALVSSLPFTGNSTGFALVSAEGESPWGAEEGLRHRVEPLFISVDYFRTMGTPLLEGRGFSSSEMTAGGQAVIVNQAFARRYFGAGRTLGCRIKLGLVESPEPFRTIVGVARDSKRGALEDDVAPTVYRPYLQRNGLRSAGLIARTAGDPAALFETARRSLTRLDGGVAASDAQTLEQRLDRSTASQKLRSVSSALLAVLALAMVFTGLYGVLALLAAQRIVELGVRMALGAAPGDIFTLVLRRGMSLALAGIAAGTLLSLAAAQSLRGLLFGVAPADPWILAGASALMLAVSAAASAVPASRAARTDPMSSLRQE